MNLISSKLTKTIRLSDNEEIEVSQNKILIVVYAREQKGCFLYTIYCSKKIRSIKYKYKNSKLQFLYNSRILNGSSYGDIEIYEASTAINTYTLVGHAYGVNKMILGGDYLVSICKNKEGRLWNIQNFQYISNFNENNNSVKNACFSTDNEIIYIICQNGAISIHESRTGKSIYKIDYQKESVHQCLYQPESNQLFVWYRIKKIITCWKWDCKTFQKTQISFQPLLRIDTIYSKENIFVLVLENEYYIVELQENSFQKFHYQCQYIRQIQFTNEQLIGICNLGVIFQQKCFNNSSLKMKKQPEFMQQHFSFITQINDNFLLGFKKNSCQLYYIKKQ